MKRFLVEAAMVAATGLVAGWLRLGGKGEAARAAWDDLADELRERDLAALRAEYRKANGG